MKYVLLIVLVFLLGSCAESVLDPDELAKKGNGTPAGGDVMYFVSFDQYSSNVSIESILTDGTNRKSLFTTAYATSAPAKGKMAFISPNGIEVGDLKDTMNRSVLAGPNMYISATLSPIARDVVYSVPTGDAANPTVALYLFTINNFGIVRIVDTAADPFIAPAFSPDGNQLAFVKKGEYPYTFDSLIVVSVTTMSRQGVYAYQFSGLGEDLELEWTPDGRKIVVIDDNYGAGVSIKFVNVNSSTEEVIIPNDPMLYLSYPTLSPDGTKLAVARTDYRNSQSSLVVYDMLGQEIAATTPIDQSIVMPCFSKDGQKVAYSTMDGIFVATEIASNTSQLATAKIMLFTIATRATTTVVSGNVLRPMFER